MLKVAMDVIKNAYSPYSKIKIGAAVLTEHNHIFSGCNIENASYGATVCAERVALWKAVSSGEKKVKEILVLTDSNRIAWPPCGLCRQVMSEFAIEEMKVHLVNTSLTQKQSLFFKDLFPYKLSLDLFKTE
ncbi:MAG: cytidine deaminase [Bdellovibrio sp.]|nr:MAG: cytidine deaminase [Bdellovibrio sp.]